MILLPGKFFLIKSKLNSKSVFKVRLILICFEPSIMGIGNNPYYCWSIEEISGNKMETSEWRTKKRNFRMEDILRKTTVKWITTIKTTVMVKFVIKRLINHFVQYNLVLLCYIYSLLVYHVIVIIIVRLFIVDITDGFTKIMPCITISLFYFHIFKQIIIKIILMWIISLACFF